MQRLDGLSHPFTLARAERNSILHYRFENYTCFPATNTLYCVCRGAVFTVVQGGQITFAQGGDGRNILACRGVIFMPGKSRRVYYNSETAKSQVVSKKIFRATSLLFTMKSKEVFFMWE